VWQSEGLRFTIPRGWVTDLASIPAGLRGMLDVNGASRCPALAHDWLYNTQRHDRAFADDVFRRALVFYGAAPSVARVYWLGVRAGGWAPWNDRLARGGGLQLSDFIDESAYRLALEALDADRP
jgi:hypothetical protein